jgi:hypothetical protein
MCSERLLVAFAMPEEEDTVIARHLKLSDPALCEAG